MHQIQSWLPWRQVRVGLLDFIFPPCCISCQRVGSLLCSVCWAETFTPVDKDRRLEGFEGFTALAYHQGIIREALHALKYQGIQEVAEPLAAALAPRILWTFDMIIPVPLHETRIRERGYNQANVLAQALSRQMGYPVGEQVLVRHKSTRTQVGLGPEERQMNVADAFITTTTPLPESILLIDDVCTTGATLTAAARALQKGGAKTIYAATISLAS